MKWQFTHPYKENVSINFGQFTQVVGENQQLKYYIWQLLIWYFGGKKYTEEDLSLFDQKEPEIFSEESLIKRTDYKLISISNVQDLIGQMSYKKGTVAFEYMKHQLNDIEVVQEIEFINDKLDQISNIVNRQLDIQINEVNYHTESQYFNAEQLLLKQFLPYFKIDNKNISFEFVDNESKFLMFLKMIEGILSQSNQKTILVLRGLDDFLSYNSFIRCSQALEKIVKENPYFYVLSFPTKEGYLYIRDSNIENVNVIADCLAHYYEFQFMYESFSKHFPSNEAPSENEFLSSLQRITPYLLTRDLNHKSLSIYDMISIKILNQLYHYDKVINYKIESQNPLLLNFLENQA